MVSRNDRGNGGRRAAGAHGISESTIMDIDPAILAYALPAIPIWAAYGAQRRGNGKRHLSIHEEAQEAGLTEPSSLHPIIDPLKCIGCSSCIKACPEGEVLGLLEDKAALIDPTRCIGHGACETACPTGAITLVFGTATRGIDIPHVDDEFQTNVPGLFIAGELGGMGLIRNAIEQGRQAVAAIAAQAEADPAPADMLDLLIVGAGPAGISASLAATERGLRFRTVEQDNLGGTVAHFPRGKLVMTEPATLPLHGQLRFREIRKEELLGIWTEVIEANGLEIGFEERVTAITPADSGFTVETSAASYRARRVLLAIGRRGTPRPLGVPGEDSSKVVYRLTDPEQYRGRKVLVVGGGDSALEAALSLSAEPDTEVTLSYRGEAFTRARKTNRDQVLAAAAEGRIDLQLQSQVEDIADKTVRLVASGEVSERRNDHIIVCAGGILPTDFLRSIGIEVERKFGTT